MLRWLHCAEISQCAELLVREAFGKTVDKVDKVARERAFIFVYLLAFWAVAVGVVAVVLAHRNHCFARVGAENRVDLCCSSLKHGWIGQTPLAGVARAAFAIDK